MRNTVIAGAILALGVAALSGCATHTNSSTFNRSEVGLHAYGNDGHFVEYDDFGLQFGPGPGPVRKGFLMPVQQ